MLLACCTQIVSLAYSQYHSVQESLAHYLPLLSPLCTNGYATTCRTRHHALSICPRRFSQYVSHFHIQQFYFLILGQSLAIQSRLVLNSPQCSYIKVTNTFLQTLQCESVTWRRNVYCVRRTCQVLKCELTIL